MLRHFLHLLLILSLTPLAWAQGPATAARVALAIGSVQRVSPNAAPAALTVNQTVSETDRIITGNDAMVILVFVDQGRVALRANSELLIKRYTIDPAGTQTAMQLELVRGSMRQISGDGAHQQPERYRLNTPIAAIGVRGTDFLAKVTDQAMETYIQDGTIVVLSLSAGDAAATAPLTTLSSGDAGRYAMVLDGGVVERRHISPEDIDRIFGIRLQTLATAKPSAAPATAANAPAKAAPAVTAMAPLDTRATDNLASTASPNLPPGSIVARPSTPQPSAPPVDAVAQPSPVPAPPVQPSLPQPVEPPAAVAVVPANTQLIWGRFTDALALPFSLPVPYAVARDGRHVTVGQLGQYAMWSQGPNGPLDKGLNGQADFKLTAGEAFYQANGAAPIALSIADPRLNVNFDRMQFSTQMTLGATGIASQQLSVSGKVNDEGIFNGKTATQQVAGALSRNGAEAGYLFNLKAADGAMQGITLWGLPQNPR